MATTTDVSSMNRRQKAAALLLALGPEEAAKLFPHLGDEEVEHLTAEIAELGDLGPEVLAAILDEVHADVRERRRTLHGDREAAERFVRAWQGTRADTTISRLLGDDDRRPFAFLRSYPVDQIGQTLGEEHPQTVALVLANLPSERGAELMQTFPDEARKDVAFRVATLAPVARSVISRVEEALARGLGEPRKADGEAAAGGARDLAVLLNQLPREEIEEIFESLEGHDVELATAVREAMFVFEDLTKLDSRAVQEVLRGVEAATLAVAMSGASDTIQQLVWSNLSERASTSVREEMELLGKVRAKDLEDAQTDVVRTVRRLADEGTITLDLGVGA